MLLHYTWENINHKNERFCILSSSEALKSACDSEKSRLDHDGNQQRSIANVQIDDL